MMDTPKARDDLPRTRHTDDFTNWQDYHSFLGFSGAEYEQTLLRAGAATKTAACVWERECRRHESRGKDGG
jgi:hypothetical protein